MFSCVKDTGNLNLTAASVTFRGTYMIGLGTWRGGGGRYGPIAVIDISHRHIRFGVPVPSLISVSGVLPEYPTNV